MKQFNAALRLRRDNDYNYEKIKGTFIPANGEICLVDTAKDGLRAKCGDGVSTFEKLGYIDGFVVTGYYKDGAFYLDSKYTMPVQGSVIRLYIDKGLGGLYYYNGENFVGIGGTVSAATETTKGIMKLYQTLGSNIDGAVSQKAVTDELNEKFEITLNEDEEMAIFIRDI